MRVQYNEMNSVSMYSYMYVLPQHERPRRPECTHAYPRLEALQLYVLDVYACCTIYIYLQLVLL